MFKIRKFSFFSFMAIIFVLISISLIIFTIKTEKRVKITGNNFLFDIQNSKYKEVFPDLVMLKGKIVSNINQDQKIEIYYDEIYQYFQLNYLEIRNPQINIFDQENKKIYYITSKIAYANNLEDINTITLKGEASISILLENIQIKGSLLVCDLINNQIKSDQDSLVIKDGFLISSKNLFINESLANFTNNVKIINQTGLYESKVVDEFINFNGSSQIATFYIRDKSIKLLNNAIVTSKML
ncbi:MAG: LPS export ABC transporter periplasmic protein LptC, partial [Exilispira sp.]